MSVFLLNTKCSVKPCPSMVYDAHDLGVFCFGCRYSFSL